MYQKEVVEKQQKKARKSHLILTVCLKKRTAYGKTVEIFYSFQYNRIKKRQVLIMKVEIQINSDYGETKVVIFAKELTEEVQNIQEKLMVWTPQVLSGFYGDRLEVIDLEDIVRIYAQDGRILLETEEKEYQLRLKLYELEERLDKGKFVRISRSEIINLKKAIDFDLSYVGTISVKLTNGVNSFVSRRYLKKVKQVLGI